MPRPKPKQMMVDQLTGNIHIVDEAKPPLCIDCIHHSGITITPGAAHPDDVHTCDAVKRTSLVTGLAYPAPMCETMRGDIQACGSVGKLFKPKADGQA